MQSGLFSSKNLDNNMR